MPTTASKGGWTSFIYQGVTTEYQVALASGQKVRVVAQNVQETWRAALVPEGSRVYVHWTSGASLVLRDGAAAATLETGDEDEPVAASRG